MPLDSATIERRGDELFEALTSRTPVAPLREIDVASHEDEFWGAVEKIGNERVMDYVFERIVTGGR